MDFEFRIFNGRLAQFRQWNNSPQDWEKRWSTVSLIYLFQKYSSGYLDEFDILTKYLPKNQPVLEAGCGNGQFVVALSAQGYQIEGIDYSELTIHRIKEIQPELNVQYGDIYCLKRPDGYYGGYLSFGVFEHNSNGPIGGLKEAHRVLSSDGVALISVPFLNRERKRWVSHLPIAINNPLSNGLSFYQYYFSKEEFVSYLEQSGFTVIDFFPYAVYAGLTRDFLIGRWLFKKRFFSYRIRKIAQEMCDKASLYFRFRYAHMMMYICRRV